MCEVEQESRGAEGWPVQRPGGLREQGVWRCGTGENAEVLGQTPGALWATRRGGGEPVTWPWKLSEKVGQSRCAGSCPEGEGERGVCMSVGFWAWVCICVSE